MAIINIVSYIILLSTFQPSYATRLGNFFIETVRKPFAAIAVASTFISSIPAFADSRDVGNMATSGFFFKDTLRISAFEDPKINGITLYLADFERPLTEKLAKDFFNDPSSSSLSCAQTGPINRNEILNKISSDPSGEEVFEENRNLFFKVFMCKNINLVSVYASIYAHVFIVRYCIYSSFDINILYMYV